MRVIYGSGSPIHLYTYTGWFQVTRWRRKSCFRTNCLWIAHHASVNGTVPITLFDCPYNCIELTKKITFECIASPLLLMICICVILPCELVCLALQLFVFTKMSFSSFPSVQLVWPIGWFTSLSVIDSWASPITDLGREYGGTRLRKGTALSSLSAPIGQRRGYEVIGNVPGTGRPMWKIRILWKRTMDIQKKTQTIFIFHLTTFRVVRN